jgi:predicted ATPase
MELLEREDCFAHLAECLGAAVHGGRIALVSGESGIGKTALLQEFSNRQRTARVLWGACDALFTPQPLAPIYDIARQTQGALLTALNSGANRDEIFTAALDELERTETLVVLEDMHWADEATLDLLKYLGRRIHRTRSMLAVTYATRRQCRGSPAFCSHRRHASSVGWCVPRSGTALPSRTPACRGNPAR